MKKDYLYLLIGLAVVVFMLAAANKSSDSGRVAPTPADFIPAI